MKHTRHVVAVNVQRARKFKQMSVPAAARRIGVHRSWWNLLEGGLVNFTIDKLEDVAHLLNVPVVELVAAPVRKSRAS